MEKANNNFVTNGVIKLPVGFRFHPTDEELVLYYLKRKVHSFPLPASLIPEIDVFRTNPWDLPGVCIGDSAERRYFFSKRKRNVNICRGITGSGYWKAIGEEKHITAPRAGRRNQAVGVKTTLVFCQGKRPSGGLTGTRWLMLEYSLLSFEATPCTSQKLMREMDEYWVVCRICQKRRESENRGTVTDEPSNYYCNKTSTWNVREIITKPSTINIMKEDSRDLGPPQPSSCSCDEITEVCSRGSDQEETSFLY